MEKSTKRIIKTIYKSKKIALFTHKSPDPDAVGSTMAFYEALKTFHKDVNLFCEDKYDRYNFVDNYKNFNPEKKNNYDLLIAIDVGSSSQLGDYEEMFLKHKNTIRIDHHEAGTNFAKQNIVTGDSACAILVYDLLNLMKIKITPTIATDLYFGICGDTGLFRNTNTDAKTFEVCSKLLKAGANIRKVYSEFFEKNTVSRLKLFSSVLLNPKLNDDVGYAILKVTLDDYKKYGASLEENIGNLPNSYLNCGYKIAVILKEREDEISCSLRSKPEYDCSKIAEKFDGGGHKNASGCSFQRNIHFAERQIEKEIYRYLKGEEKC